LTPVGYNKCFIGTKKGKNFWKKEKFSLCGRKNFPKGLKKRKNCSKSDRKGLKVVKKVRKYSPDELLELCLYVSPMLFGSLSIILWIIAIIMAV